MPADPPPPWWALPNAAALDAPVVAVVWQRFLADRFGVSVPWAATAALAAAVWAVYLGDRWLDARRGARHTDRHLVAARYPRRSPPPRSLSPPARRRRSRRRCFRPRTCGAGRGSRSASARTWHSSTPRRAAYGGHRGRRNSWSASVSPRGWPYPSWPRGRRRARGFRRPPRRRRVLDELPTHRPLGGRRPRVGVAGRIYSPPPSSPGRSRCRRRSGPRSSARSPALTLVHVACRNAPRTARVLADVALLTPLAGQVLA